MRKTILITGSTDGIGLETARLLHSQGHQVLLHGRNPDKLQQVEKMLSGSVTTENAAGPIDTYLADLSRMTEVAALAKAVVERYTELDVLINNAGIFRTSDPITPDGLDVRFAVNTLAPCLLTQRLLPLLGRNARVINLSSAAQASVNPDALAGRIHLSDQMDAYAQSKLAITMWSNSMAVTHKKGPLFIAVNPGSLLATKMVKEGFGMAGKDVRIGADILVRAALSDEFAGASGKYFDNDTGQFSSPHPDALDARKSERIVRAIEAAAVGSIQQG